MSDSTMTDLSIQDSTIRDREGQTGWFVVFTTELHRLWLGWRGPLLLLAFAVFLSVYLVLLALDPEMNVLSQRKMISMTIQATALVGIIAVVLLGADSFSGERDQRSLESLLLTPVPKGQLVIGKLLAILSLWPPMILIAIPYVALVSSGTELTTAAVLMLVIPGTLLVVLSASVSIFISALSPTNLISFAASFLVLLLLAAPTQLPGSVKDLNVVHWFIVANPITAVAEYQATVIDGEPWTEGLSLLLSPVLALALVIGLGTWYLNKQLSLQGGFSR